MQPALRPVGLIADTHGLLRPAVLAALDGVQHILHAGDVGGSAVLAGLREIAPVSAVRGNNDNDPWGRRLPACETVELSGVRVHVLHQLPELALDPVAAAVAVVVSGHSHQPRLEERDGVLYVNPGSAGPRRFRLPISLGLLHLDGARPRVELVTLPDEAAAGRR